MTPPRTIGTLVAAAALALGGLVVSPSVAPAAAAACSGTSGVTVVIGSSVRCASGDPASGLAALGAVASVTQVQRQPGFVCRIDGAPASDACVNTPPANAYWSYWHAQPGGSWQYSNVGAGSYNPVPGSVEGWAFGAGAPPSVAPPAGPAPAPSTTTTSPSGGGGAGGGGGSGGTTPSSGGSVVKPTTRGDAGRTATVAAPTGAASTAGAPTTAAPTTSAPTSSDPAGAATVRPPTTGTTVQRQEASALRQVDDPSGLSLSPLLGGALVLLLAVAAAAVAWRRRAGADPTG